MLVFGESGKLEYPGKYLQEQREPTNLIHGPSNLVVTYGCQQKAIRMITKPYKVNDLLGLQISSV